MELIQISSEKKAPCTRSLSWVYSIQRVIDSKFWIDQDLPVISRQFSLSYRVDYLTGKKVALQIIFFAND